MDKKLFRYELLGFVFVCLLGTAMHFFFEWSNNSVFVGLFCPVNESVWEHLKLLYMPFSIWSIIEFFNFKSKKCFFFSRAAGILSGLLATVFIYYTFTGASGNESMVIDIASFIIGVGVSFLIGYIILKNRRLHSLFAEICSVLFLLVVFCLFILFTFAPPCIPLFEDMQNLSFGISL